MVAPKFFSPIFQETGGGGGEDAATPVSKVEVTINW